MSQYSRPTRRLVSVHEPVRMDLAYNGARFIISEFVVVTLISLTVGVLELALFLSQGHGEIHLASGAFFLSCALNSLTFLLIAIDTIRRNDGMKRSDYRGGQAVKCTLLAVILLLLPLVFPLLALSQSLDERAASAGK